MNTDCKTMSYDFQDNHRRRVTADFNGGAISSDSGGLFLREIDDRFGVTKRFTRCFTDLRDANRIEHTVHELLKQRTYALALGYEDLNDHDELRLDPLLATLVGKADPTGQNREKSRDRGKALAGKSTLNRLELPVNTLTDQRYKKIEANFEMIEKSFIDLFVQKQKTVPNELILDFDATDDPIHGQQEGRFFHGYYRNYCYLPLYIFCGHSLLCAKLRSSNCDASQGTIDELQRIIPQLRKVWPEVKIIIRADSGFCREPIMNWCENNAVDYVLGLAKNSRLVEEISTEIDEARKLYLQTKQPARLFREFQYETQKTWSRCRRVIGKAEYLSKGSNPRFIVTSLSRERIAGQRLYEKTYCSRGDMENRIKEQQQMLFADRTSTMLMQSNQLRLWMSSIAYVLIQTLREFALTGTKLASAQCDTIRLKLFKIGGLVRISARRVWVSMCSSYPYKDLFQQVCKKLLPLRC